tara:strand:+ start:1137 stop:1259 length:123 start_codon:yes stop_codon:yes gene_type:complete
MHLIHLRHVRHHAHHSNVNAAACRQQQRQEHPDEYYSAQG